MGRLPRALLLSAALLALSIPARADGATARQTEARQRLPVTETVSARTSRSGPEDRSGVFTVNRVRLFVIAAQQGTERVLLPPMAGDKPAPVMNEAVDSVIRAVERIRKRYPYEDLQVVSQSQYLLQAYRGSSGGFDYQMVSDPGAVTYSAERYWGELEARTTDGQLAMDLRVLREQRSLFEISLLLDPGRTLVVGKNLVEGGALFAVLTLDHPDAPLRFEAEDASTAEAPSEAEDARERSSEPVSLTAVEDPVPAAVDPQHIYEKWDEGPRLLDYTQPDYPDIARKAGVEGTVTLHLVVGRDGKVEEVSVFRSTPRLIFDLAAQDAVKEWRYTPARVDGRPVRARISQTLRFVLNGPGR